MKLFASKRTQRVTNFALAALLVVSTLTTSLSFVFAQKAHAAPNVSYTSSSFVPSDWTIDREAPSGGWTADAAHQQIDLNVDQTKSNATPFYKTEGVSRALPAGTGSIKASVYVSSDWSTKPSLRVGLWGVAQDAGLTGPSYPIIEYSTVDETVAGTPNWRVWNANDGTWHNVAAVTHLNADNTVEIVANPNTGNYDFYVNNTKLSYSYTAAGYTNFTNMIFNDYNLGGDAAGNYSVVWSHIKTGVTSLDYSDVYVSNTGSDANNGVTITTPFATVQKAINSVAAGGTVHIANGTYTEKLSFTKGNVAVVGESKTGTIIKPLSNEYGQGFTDEGFSGVTIKRLTVQADASTSGGSAIKVHNAKNITLQNLDVNGTGYLRGIDINAVDGVKLNDIKVNGFGKNGIAFTSQYAATDSYKTGSVKLTNIKSTNNGWAGLAFYAIGGGGAAADINGVTFNGANVITGNGQAGIFFEGGSDAGFTAHSAPTYAITGAGSAAVDLANTTLSGNGFNVVNYQTKNVYATSATINGVVGNSMTTPQIQAAEASIIDHNDYNSYGDVILDTNAPIVAITNPADGAVLKGHVNVTGTVTDTDPSVSYLTVTNDTTHSQILVQNVNTGLTNPSLSWDTTAYSDGAYTIHLEAKDAAGNEDSTVSVKDIHVTVDNTKPVITVKSSPDTIGSGGIYSKLSLKLYDNNAVASYQVDGGAIVPLSHNQYSDVNGIAVGSYHGAHAGANTITVYDVAGNSTTLNFVLDNTAPTATIDNNAPVSLYGPSTNINVHAIDDNYLQTDLYQVGSTTPFKTYTGEYFGLFWLGSGDYRMVVRDVAGNSTEYDFTIDKVAPTAAFTFPARGPSATGFSVTYSEAVNAADATNPANYFLTNWPGAGGSGDLTGHATVSYDAASKTATIHFTTPGWYISGEQMWGVSGVRDIAGNAITTTTAYSSVLTSPTAPGVPTAITPSNNLTTNWTWTAATDLPAPAADASGIKGYQYQFTQGSTVITDWTDVASNSVATTAPTEGTYELHVRALDNAGNPAGPESVGTVVIDTTPPSVTISGYTANSNVITPAVVTTESGLTYAWTPNDTTSANNVTISDPTAAEPTFTANQDGNYAFTLTTKDSVGNPTTTTFNFTYTTPVQLVQNTATPAVTTTTTPQATGFTAVTTTTNGSPAAVLGVTTGDPSADAGVKGATDTKTQTATTPATTDTKGGMILGFAWYWWLLLLAIIAAIITAIRRRLVANATA